MLERSPGPLRTPCTPLTYIMSMTHTERWSSRRRRSSPSRSAPCSTLSPTGYCNSASSRIPTSGALIRGTGGLRKIRWQGSGRGKRGGVRVIYYWATNDDVILMLLMYPKSEKDDLTPEQRKVLAAIVQEEFK